MADISKEINDFRVAVYGRDVRESMISLAEKVNEEVETNTTHVDEAVTTANGASQKATKASEEVQKAITEANTTLQEANAAKVSAQESATASAGSASAAAGSASAASGSAANAAASAKAVEDIAAGLGGFDGTATSVKATDTHSLGSTNVQGQLDALADGLNNIDMSASSVTAVDTQGLAVNAGENSTVQALIDVIADKVMTKLLEKTAIVQTESTATNKVPSSAYLKQVKDSIDSNLDKISNCISAVKIDITLSATQYTYVDYPEGYTFDNSAVIASSVLLNGEYITLSYPNPAILVSLRQDKIVVLNNNAAAYNAVGYILLSHIK